MTGIFYLDWAILAVSLCNTILQLWLGLTILLNAERRTGGIWLAGGSLLMGGAFFVSHSAILGLGLDAVGEGMNFWWHAGWAPVVALPFAWYVVTLWYAGFWDGEHTSLHRRQRPLFILALLLTVVLLGLLLFANPLPSFSQAARLDLSPTLSLGGVPLLVMVYPLYIVVCISLSLDALRQPGPSSRVMGDLARRRARPWLIAASVTLLLVSLLVAWVMYWIVLNARQRTFFGLYTQLALTLGGFDLVIAVLIATATLLVGRAVVSYEVFTGKTLPRHGLLRQWRSAVILAGGYGLVMGWSLTRHLPPGYSLLLTTLLLTLFYALFSWRSYAERERYIHQLRPFIVSQRLYEQLLTSSPTALPEVDMAAPFKALCQDVLGVRVAYLAALGPLAPLVGPGLAYPDGAAFPLPGLAEITTRFGSPQTMCVPLDPARYHGALWAVPLWSERGLIGVLLLGEKADGGLYAQEEIEIARASGERLIDTQASAELARRLMALQRQRLAESQVLDRHARRVLHDDVLPEVHAALLALSRAPANATGAPSEAISLLADAHSRIAGLLREMPTTAAPEVARLGLIGALRQVVADELGMAFDAVAWEIEPEVEHRVAALPSLTAEVLFYAAREAIRNAARYGRPANTTSSLHLHIAVTWRDGLSLVIEDDGVGLEAARPSSTRSGQGLALHSTMMAVIGGTLTVESGVGAYPKGHSGTRVLLRLP